MKPPALPWRPLGWGLAALLLLAPALAMLVTPEVRWGPGDFLAAAAMLGTIGLAAEWAAAGSRRRWLVAGAVTAGVLLLGAELAVGILS